MKTLAHTSSRAFFPIRTRRAGGAPVASVRGDALVVRLVTILFVALLFEGVARKWLFPGQHALFYFLRDPLVILLYFVVLFRGFPASRWFVVWLSTALFLSFASLAVYRFEGKPLVVWALGVRNYFEYVFLAFIVAGYFRRAEVSAFVRVVALLAPAAAFVAVLQFFAPPGSWINLGAGGAIPPALAGDVLRTTGLMASDAQHYPYVLFTLAASIVGYLLAFTKSARLRFLAGISSSLVMMVVSGSRGIWMLGAATFLAVFGAAILARVDLAKRARAIGTAVLMAALVVGLFSTVLYRAWEAYEERNRAARTFSAAIVERITGMFLPGWMFEASLTGEGIGIATTGAAAAMTGERALTLAENDWDRNFVELGLIGGWLFVGLRVAFSAWLVWIGIRAARSGEPTALVFASFAAPAILVTQITMHTVYGHLAWMAAGLTMAAARAATGEGATGAVEASERGPTRISASRRLVAIRGRRWPRRPVPARA